MHYINSLNIFYNINNISKYVMNKKNFCLFFDTKILPQCKKSKVLMGLVFF